MWRVAGTGIVDSGGVERIWKLSFCDRNYSALLFLFSLSNSAEHENSLSENLREPQRTHPIKQLTKQNITITYGR